MTKTKQLASRLREVILNGTWIARTNFKDQLSQVNFKEATQKVSNLNTIALLTFHVNYYLEGVSNVFKGGDLEIRDKYSFDMTALESEEDWEAMKQKLYVIAEEFAKLVEDMPDSRMEEGFVDPKYGTYERNIEAMIEHAYYHLGQVVILRKMVKGELG